MGAPLGNQNGAKAKQWTAAIERALERRGDPSIDPDHPFPRGPRARALDDLADKFLAQVELEGIRGFREFGDRLDGKAPQAITGENGNPLTLVIQSADANVL